MAVIYEVWDTLTSNRLAAFPIQEAAEELLLDVLRVNGVEAARDMAVLASNSDAPDDEPELVVDGVEFVTSQRLPT